MDRISLRILYWLALREKTENIAYLKKYVNESLGTGHRNLSSELILKRLEELCQRGFVKQYKRGYRTVKGLNEKIESWLSDFLDRTFNSEEECPEEKLYHDLCKSTRGTGEEGARRVVFIGPWGPDFDESVSHPAFTGSEGMVIDKDPRRAAWLSQPLGYKSMRFLNEDAMKTSWGGIAHDLAIWRGVAAHWMINDDSPPRHVRQLAGRIVDPLRVGGKACVLSMNRETFTPVLLLNIEQLFRLAQEFRQLEKKGQIRLTQRRITKKYGGINPYHFKHAFVIERIR